MGIQARIQHQLESVATPHWHIDFLLTFAVPLEVWYAISDRKLEQDWAELLQQAPGFREPIPRFGSSDYRRSCTSHLFYAKRRPAFRWFEQTVRHRFEPDIRPRQWLIPIGGAVGPGARPPRPGRDETPPPASASV